MGGNGGQQPHEYNDPAVVEFTFSFHFVLPPILVNRYTLLVNSIKEIKSIFISFQP
jgi:hypothetical protein